MRYAIVLAALSMPVIAWFNQRGYFGPDNGTLSDRYPTLLVAAGYAFAIWGLIFALDVLLALSQARRRGMPHAVTDRARPALLLGFGLTAAWMIVFSQQLFWLALLVIWGALAAVLWALFEVQRAAPASSPTNSPTSSPNGTPSAPAQPVEGARLARVALGLHAGWLSLAAFLNTAQVIVAYGLLPADRMLPWSLVLWLAAGALLLVVNARLRLNLPYVLAALWGLVGVVIQQRGSPLPGADVSAGVAAALAAVVALQAVVLRRGRG